MSELDNRRGFLSLAAAGILFSACREDDKKTASQATDATPSTITSTSTKSTSTDAGRQPKDEEAEEVSALEDLMREHGVIRRVLIVYREAARRLRAKPASAPHDALQKAAKLMRSFGEDYHEKELEEAHVFPALTTGGGALTATVNTLVAQHQRGRAITDYVLTLTRQGIGAQDAEALARTLEGFARMYEMHAALEDTIVFPALKKVLSARELDEMGDRFEDIERKTFGKDGFEDAVRQVGDIETSLGIDLPGMTAPPPPK